MDQFESLVRHIFSSISAPDAQPELTFVNTDQNLLLITVSAPSDRVGQLIGKEGKIIKAVRTILNLSFPTVKYQIDFGTPAPTATAESNTESTETVEVEITE
jgi:predicted RNA-binding protein YlqC (UPF0109 family)